MTKVHRTPETRGKRRQTQRYHILGWLRSGTLRAGQFARFRETLVSQRCAAIKFNARAKGMRVGLRREGPDRALVARLIMEDCHWCGERIAGGVDRVYSSRHYVPRNLVPSCAPCNMAKGAMHPHHFVDVAHVIARRHGVKADKWTGTPHPRATWSRKARPTYRQWLHELSPAERARVCLTRAEFETLCGAACFFCGRAEARGVDRSVDPAGAYVSNNVRPACMVCNWTRRSMETKDFLRMCRRVARRHAARGFGGETRVNGFAYCIS